MSELRPVPMLSLQFVASWRMARARVRNFAGLSLIVLRRIWNRVVSKLSRRYDSFASALLVIMSRAREEIAHILEVESNLFAAENKYISDALHAAIARFEVSVIPVKLAVVWFSMTGSLNLPWDLRVKVVSPSTQYTAAVFCYHLALAIAALLARFPFVQDRVATKWFQGLHMHRLLN